VGFRNPATSADAVDTGQGGSFGVRLYQRPGNPGSGVAQWNAGGSSATAELLSSATGSGGAFWDFSLAGGPTLELALREAAAGGYESHASVSVAWDDLIPWTDVPLLTGAAARFAPYTATDAPGNWGWPKYRKTATRGVQLEGVLQITNVSFGSGQVIATFPPGCRPRRMVTGLALGMGDAAWRWLITEAGALQWINYVGSGGSDVVGQYLSLNRIGWTADN